MGGGASMEDLATAMPASGQICWTRDYTSSAFYLSLHRFREIAYCSRLLPCPILVLWHLLCTSLDYSGTGTIAKWVWPLQDSVASNWDYPNSSWGWESRNRKLNVCHLISITSKLKVRALQPLLFLPRQEIECSPGLFALPLYRLKLSIAALISSGHCTKPRRPFSPTLSLTCTVRNGSWSWCEACRCVVQLVCCTY